MVKNADLHMHSCYSDGQMSPKNLVRLAKKRRVKHLALTDHNSVKGVDEAIVEGERIGVDVVPAVEVEVDTGEILGYFIDYKNKSLLKELRLNSRRTESKTRDWCSKLEKAGYKVSFEEIERKFPKARGNISSFYLLHLLYKRGYGRPLELAPKLWEDERTRPKSIKKTPILKAIRLIKNAGGVPVLAHPWMDDMEINFKNMQLLVRVGLNGIEINNGDRTPLRKSKDVKKIRSLARKYGLILTSGSDFHGKELVKLMPGNHNLGKNNCDERIIEDLRRLARK